MPIPVTCPKCGLKSKAPDQAIGKKVRCKCGEKLLVAAAETKESRSSKPSGDTAASKPLSTKAPPGSRESRKVALTESESSSSPSLFDLLTESDQQATPINPYAVVEKSLVNDAAALKGYLRDDEAKITQAKQSQSNLLIITLVLVFGVIRNIALLVIAFAFLKEIPGALFVNPFLIVGGSYVAVLIVYALFDLAAVVGMVLRKPWGWWLAVFGLGWAIAERIASFVVVCLTNEEFSGPLIVGIAALVLCGFGFVLLASLMSKDSRKSFRVETKPAIVWPLVLLLPLAIEGGITAGFYSAARDAIAEL
jgi:hypothetical protein